MNVLPGWGRWLLVGLFLAGPACTSTRLVRTREDVLREIPGIMGELEEIRGLEFREEPKVRLLAPGEFDEKIWLILEAGMGIPRVGGWLRSLGELGILPGDFDLLSSLKSLRSGPGVIYDETSKDIVLLQRDRPAGDLRGQLIGALADALQDQHFDRSGMVSQSDVFQNTDELLALLFLMQGESMCLKTLYSFQKKGEYSNGKLSVEARYVLRFLSRLDYPQFIKFMLTTDKSIPARSAQLIRDLPGGILRLIFEPAMRGTVAIHDLRSSRGWASVSALFRDPPSSTEAYLHPEKLLTLDDPPIDVEIADLTPVLGPEWRVIHEDTLGEFLLMIWMDQHLTPRKEPHEGSSADERLRKMVQRKPTRGEKVASGWGGDRYALYEDENDRRVLSILITWDAEEDAKRFLDAMPDLFRARFGEAASVSTSEGGLETKVTGGDDPESIRVVRRGKNIAYLSGPGSLPTDEMIHRLLETGE